MTATEFFEQGNFNNVTDMLVEFAKLKCKEQLEAIKNKTELWDDCAVVPLYHVNYAYNLDNIQ